MISKEVLAQTLEPLLVCLWHSVPKTARLCFVDHDPLSRMGRSRSRPRTRTALLESRPTLALWKLRFQQMTNATSTMTRSIMTLGGAVLHL
jgi:hypothetical protein